ncbi:unnamed protein product [Fusarium graminearum]|uniref:Chromosome 3, complete genome n=1 Tax=Gibberella zeae (strain ATCC MYA-4620 / CBS 123657 / FGSC 9075 / NRRL 31084 / PH-1) TaxID=229533 RepID=A0A0E0SN00_GIBZE|nr:hypothetical protein FG05_35186 [Fusarium graminearum]CEF87813.1 unnamed protein product [Fusarium graminearum]
MLSLGERLMSQIPPNEDFVSSHHSRHLGPINVLASRPRSNLNFTPINNIGLETYQHIQIHSCLPGPY